MSYQDKKQFFEKMLTIYGRNPVEEALSSPELNVYKLHLADSNKEAGIIQHCIKLAQKRNIPIEWHNKKQLSFISKNAKQDQGIALDIQLDGLKSMQQLDPQRDRNLILLDNVTNPQNLGMIIRSACAGYIDGLVIPKKGCAELGSLAIKASAGSLFKASIFRPQSTLEALKALQATHTLVELHLDAKQSLHNYDFAKPSVFILGNESTGVSREASKLCDHSVRIPMNNQVESLNVAITAALISFHHKLLV